MFCVPAGLWSMVYAPLRLRQALIRRMEDATKDDRSARKRKQPGTKKLQMLDEVCDLVSIVVVGSGGGGGGFVTRRRIALIGTHSRQCL